MWIIPLSLLITFELLADVLSKEWALHGLAIRFVGAILGYIIANVFWLFALKDGSGLARGAMIFSVASAVIAVGLGVFLYHEKVSTMEVVGMILGVIAITLILWQAS